MNDKELIKFLNDLNGSVEMDRQWADCNREVLLSQISAASSDGPVSRFEVLSNFFKLYMERISQPAWAVAVLGFIFIMVGGIASYNAAQNTAPGDSLYIAKIISEKTRAVITWGELEKAKLNTEFASNRVEEITKLLSDGNKRKEEQDKKVEELTLNFKKELSEAKSRLDRMQVANRPAPAPAAKTNDQPNVAQNPSPKNDVAKDSGTKTDERRRDSEVIGANLGRSNEGMQFSEQGPQAVLDEAEKLFDRKDYTGTADKLKEAKDLIRGDAKDDVRNDARGDVRGDVRGESESATSTGK